MGVQLVAESKATRTDTHSVLPHQHCSILAHIPHVAIVNISIAMNSLAMFRAKYKTVKQEEDNAKSGLPDVLCSALSASVLLDRKHEQEDIEDMDDLPIYFSSLAASILDEQRRQQNLLLTAAAAEEEPRQRQRRRHPAQVQTPGRRRVDNNNTDLDVEDCLMEPLVSLRLEEDEQVVEMRTLLEEQINNQMDETDEALRRSDRRRKMDKDINAATEGRRTRKRTAAMNLAMVSNASSVSRLRKDACSMDDSPEGFFRGVKTLMQRLFSA